MNICSVTCFLQKIRSTFSFCFICRANLSRDYFVDRQDRYFLFENCPQLTDFFAELLSRVASHSFTLERDGSMRPPTALPYNPLSSWRKAQKFRTSLSSVVNELISAKPSDKVTESKEAREGLDTVVYPLVQMGYYGICQDELVTQRVLSSVESTDELHLASGYFNLPPQYINAIFTGKGMCSVLAASPQVQSDYSEMSVLCLMCSELKCLLVMILFRQANGFYGGRGVAGHVPMMYIHFARKFLQAIDRHGYQDRIKYLEYYRKGWTFHGKGLWFYSEGEDCPSLTLMGSTNYGNCSLDFSLIELYSYIIAVSE